MEVIRPTVDLTVSRIFSSGSPPCFPEAKQLLLSELLLPHNVDGETVTLFEMCSRMTSSIVRVYEAGRGALTLPEV